MLKGFDIRFVSKCPENFGLNLKERALNAAEAASCSRSTEYPDLDVFDCVFSMVDRKNDSFSDIKTVVCFSDASVRKELHKARAKRKKVEETILGYVDGRSWNSIEELEGALSQFDLPANCSLDYTTGTYEVPGKADHRGRRRKGEIVPPVTLHFVERLWVYMDEEAALVDARRASASVLVTDIPCTESDRRCYRDGMTADGIIRLYREEYRVEHCIRFTKNGVGIDQVFLQTPSRERAMMFVETPQGKEIDLFEITDALQINPRLLLGYLES